MKYVPKSVTRFAGRSALKLNANSPTILVVAGVVGFGVTAVMAAKASKHADYVFDDHKKNRIQIGSTAVTDELEQKAVVALYMDTAVSLGKIYGPTIVVGTISATSILYGHRILKGRHVASLLAYSGLQEQFLNYRARVVKTLGNQAEQDIFNGAHGEWLEDPDRKGEYKLAPVFSDAIEADYLHLWFDENNDNCRMDPMGNYLWLKGVQQHMNDLLLIKGHLFLNEVFKALGMPEVPEGQVAGWLYNSDGDNLVDFGFLTGTDPHTIAFRGGLERTVQFNFNIDGNIYEKMLANKYRN